MKYALLALPALLIVLPASAVRADPPAIPGYARLGELQEHLLTTLSHLQQQEAFERKPYPEKLLLWFEQGLDKTPDSSGKRLTAEFVVRELFRWDRMREHDAPPEITQIVLVDLPRVMREKFRDVVPIPKTERFKAAMEIADYLNDEFFHIRKAAIDAIVAIYNESKAYDPTMSPRDRRKKEQEIKDMIRKLR